MAENTTPTDDWLNAEADRLALGVVASRRADGGFGWLDDDFQLVPDRPAETYVTARMTHVAGLEVLRGNDAAANFLDHGMRAFDGPLRDGEFGGWLSSTGPDGTAEKRAYDHCFVVLAAATATVTGHPRATTLLTKALECLEARFWDDERGLLVDTWDREWQQCEPYRGANANMHGVEAMLAAADATGDDVWHQRALRVAETLVHQNARAAQWRLPEHFDDQWQALPDYNRGDPAHAFRPYGATIGHLFEWSRLLLHLQHGLSEPPSWLRDDARSLFDTAVREGWAVDGAPGFVYTVDADGAPVVRSRMHWVLCEAIAAAEVWRQHEPSAELDGWLGTWWGYAQEHLIDIERGGWQHELGPDNTPAAGTWSGRPDVYHAYQATIIGLLPPGRSIAGALRDR